MRHSLSYCLLCLLTFSGAVGNAKERTLFTFDQPEASKAWRAVNDGVMGGLSQGRFRINDERNLEFFGTLSLENNGGFASVRAAGAALGMEENESVFLRVRGDGREYRFNLYTQRNLGGYSFRQPFKTKNGEWVEVELPMNQFVATWRGRVFPNEKFDPRRTKGVGILLGDKKAGPFRLEVEWIKAGASREAELPAD